MVQERGLLPGPRVGSCLTFGNELFEKTHVNKARLYWEESRTLRKLMAVTWLAISDFVVMGLVSRLSLASHFF